MISVTTHQSALEGLVWNIGGSVAEEDHALDPQTLIARASRVVKEALDLQALEHAIGGTFYVDRAEPTKEAGARPKEIGIYSP